MLSERVEALVLNTIFCALANSATHSHDETRELCAGVLQWFTVCCSVLQHVAKCFKQRNAFTLHGTRVECCSVSQRVEACCNVLQSALNAAFNIL